MTGRDLIIYILENGLENEMVVEDENILELMTVEQAAKNFGVGTETIKIWAIKRYIKSFVVGNILFIPANEEDPRKEAKCEEKTQLK